jgi:hypothetical protein
MRDSINLIFGKSRIKINEMSLEELISFLFIFYGDLIPETEIIY